MNEHEAEKNCNCKFFEAQSATWCDTWYIVDQSVDFPFLNFRGYWVKIKTISQFLSFPPDYRYILLYYYYSHNNYWILIIDIITVEKWPRHGTFEWNSGFESSVIRHHSSFSIFGIREKAKLTNYFKIILNESIN